MEKWNMRLVRSWTPNWTDTVDQTIDYTTWYAGWVTKGLMKRPHGYQPKTSPTHQNSASYSTSGTPINWVPRTVQKSPGKLFSFSFSFTYHLDNFPPSLSFSSLTLTMFFSFSSSHLSFLDNFPPSPSFFSLTLPMFFSFSFSSLILTNISWFSLH